MTAPRILEDLQSRRLEAQRRLAGSCAPEDEMQTRARRWPVKQPQDAIEAACRAGHAYFTREADPARAEQRYDRMPTRAKEARAAEFLAMANAFKAAGGRI